MFGSKVKPTYATAQRIMTRRARGYTFCRHVERVLAAQGVVLDKDAHITFAESHRAIIFVEEHRKPYTGIGIEVTYLATFNDLDATVWRSGAYRYHMLKRAVSLVKAKLERGSDLSVVARYSF
ncbi:hypothetical protein [Vibrio phage V-YDF132]|nr:hypothetical protein [Vibrio phage V-YDF132]